MDDKDKRIEQLEIQLRAQKQMNNGMLLTIWELQGEVEKLLADSNALLKSASNKFSRFKEQDTSEKHSE